MSEAIIIAILGSSSVAAIVTAVINAVLARSKQFKLLETADRIILKDRLKHLGKSYISRGTVSVEELEDLHEMFNCYRALGGTGFDAVINRVNSLKVSPSEVM